MKLTKTNALFILTFAYASFIFYLSSISDLRPPSEWTHLFINFRQTMYNSDYLFLFAPFYPLIKQQDKVLHILLYFGFGIILYLTLISGVKSILKALIFGIFLGTIYGISDEFHQMFVPGRTASTMDLVADITGLIFALVVILLFYLIKAIFNFMIKKYKIEKSS